MEEGVEKGKRKKRTEVTKNKKITINRKCTLRK